MRRGASSFRTYSVELSGFGVEQCPKYLACLLYLVPGFKVLRCEISRTLSALLDEIHEGVTAAATTDLFPNGLKDASG